MTSVLTSAPKTSRKHLKKLLYLNVSVPSMRSIGSCVCRLGLHVLGHFQGAVFVSVNARKHLESRYLSRPGISILNSRLLAFLKNSNYIDDIDAIVEAFDETTKIYFKSDADAQFIRFGSTQDNDFEHNIKFGQLKLDGYASH